MDVQSQDSAIGRVNLTEQGAKVEERPTQQIRSQSVGSQQGPQANGFTDRLAAVVDLRDPHTEPPLGCRELGNVLLHPPGHGRQAVIAADYVELLGRNDHSAAVSAISSR